LHRLVRAAAIVDLLAFATYGYIISQLSNISFFDSGVDPWLRLAQALCVLGVVGAGIAVANLVEVWREKGVSWWGRVSSLAIAVACLAFVWFALSLHLIAASTQF
jgi:hypothetical protein